MPTNHLIRPRIFVSGLHSNVNPLPGIGIARSVRAALPNAELIGVDYAASSTGLHWRDFDHVEVPGGWNDLDLSDYARVIQSRVREGCLWISGLDLETHWLSQVIPPTDGLLIPPTSSLRSVAKPASHAAKMLGLNLPPFLQLTADDSQIFDFAARFSWRLWLKGPYYSALPVRSWREFLIARNQLAYLWSTTNDLFLQAHVDGGHESIVFAALKGNLLGAAMMRKTDTTNDGKTWAGKVSRIPDMLLRQLNEVVQTLSWSGGAEIECLRDENGELWLMDWNPRFPAWVYGLTLAGLNLPAILVLCAGSKEVIANDLQGFKESSEFVRVVVEIPKSHNQSAFPSLLPVRPKAYYAPCDSDLVAMHPSGMPVLANLIRQPADRRLRSSAGDVNWLSAEKIGEIIAVVRGTPRAVFLPDVATLRFGTVETLKGNHDSGHICVTVAYSIKTNPSIELLECAVRNGLAAETISQDEIRLALSNGFAPDRVILNGPAPLTPSPAGDPGRLKAIFADSIEDFQMILTAIQKGKCTLPSCLGFRIRPGNIPSRFGIPVVSEAEMRMFCECVAQVPPDCRLGMQVHFASSVIGLNGWESMAHSLVELCLQLRLRIRRPIAVLDFGGGWTPQQWEDLFKLQYIARLMEHAKEIETTDEIILEPGKALAQPCYLLVSRVVSVRRGPTTRIREIVCDCSIAEIPDLVSYPHRFLLYRQQTSELSFLPNGSVPVLGRLCMEHDIIAYLEVPPDMAVGDYFIVLDVGAYDSSMRFPFGQGTAAEFSAQ